MEALTKDSGDFENTDKASSRGIYLISSSSSPTPTLIFVLTIIVVTRNASTPSLSSAPPSSTAWVSEPESLKFEDDPDNFQSQVEIKFRLSDGSDIGPKAFPAATSVTSLKESIIAQWPKEKENGPRTVKDVKLISAGKILEDNKTLGECQSPLCDIPGGVTTMHVVIQPPSLEKEKKATNKSKQSKCVCVIL